jgi:hypothetical protein
MVRRIASFCGLAALTLLTVTPANAQDVVTGTVRQVDPRTGVIVLDDGRRVQTGHTTVLLAERPVDRLTALAPGTRVVIVKQEPSASPRLAPDTFPARPFGSNSLQAP